ncbi:hypothetical protein D3C81_2263580 [compost metagenome]
MAGGAKDRASEDHGILINANGAAAVARLRIGAVAFHAAVLLLFAVSVLKLSAQSFSPFLYFQF